MIPYSSQNKQDFESEPYESENEKKVRWHDRILLHRPSKVIMALIITSIAIPLILYHFVMSSTLDLPPSDGYSFGSCLISRETRLLCGKGNVTEAECHQQCCYDLSNLMCFHRLPSRFSYIMDREWTEDLDLLPRVATEPFASQPSLTNVRLSIKEVTSTHLTISFYDSRHVEPDNATRLETKNYSYVVSSPELNLEVQTDHGVIFNTMRGPLIASNNIWEIAFKLTNESMFGFGEIPIVGDTSKVIYSHRGGMSSVPLIFALLNGSYHGLLIDVQTPTEVLFRADNQVVIRSITSSELKFHVFVGPEPSDVMRDVMSVIGHNNHLQYWMLGAHICNSYATLSVQEASEKFSDFITTAKVENMPYESHCGVVPIVLNSHSDDELEVIRNGVSALREEGKRYVPHVSPYIQYNVTTNETDDSSTEDLRFGSQYFDSILLKYDTDDIYVGNVEGVDVVYPDYQNESSVDLLKALWPNATFDGAILENNWPLDEAYTFVNETHLHLPYFSQNFEQAFNETPLWKIVKPNGNTYMYEHNRYGHDFYEAIKEIATEEIPIATTSHWMNGKVAINRQHIDTSWTNLRKELVETALGGVSGHWLWSSPICGDTKTFNPDTQSNLCVKWYLAGTYLPLLKIHSTETERHPLSFSGNSRLYTNAALDKRTSLLPYFYTVLQEGPLLRPMFYQFPHSEPLQRLTSQFSVGDDLLIVPDLLPSQSHVHVWMPPGTWFEFGSGLKITAEEGDPVTMTSTEADLLTFIRGGAVVFLQKHVRSSAEETRLQSNYSLTIALECLTDVETTDTDNCQANGKLFITDNMTLHVTANAQTLTVTAEGEDYASFCEPGVAISANVIEEINIYGLREEDNNYDHHKHVETEINLCLLGTYGVIEFQF